jgi:hypothetical protein
MINQKRIERNDEDEEGEEDIRRLLHACFLADDFYISKTCYNTDTITTMFAT